MTAILAMGGFVAMTCPVMVFTEVFGLVMNAGHARHLRAPCADRCGAIGLSREVVLLMAQRDTRDYGRVPKIDTQSVK
jgi:hypothetical protein